MWITLFNTNFSKIQVVLTRKSTIGAYVTTTPPCKRTLCYYFAHRCELTLMVCVAGHVKWSKISTILWLWIAYHFVKHDHLLTTFVIMLVRHRTRSTFAHGLVCCLMAPSHYLYQRWLIIRVSCVIPVRAISHEVLMKLFHNMCSDIRPLTLLPYFTRANEFTKRCGTAVNVFEHIILNGTQTGWHLLKHINAYMLLRKLPFTEAKLALGDAAWINPFFS